MQFFKHPTFFALFTLLFANAPILAAASSPTAKSTTDAAAHTVESKAADTAAETDMKDLDEKEPSPNPLLEPLINIAKKLSQEPQYKVEAELWDFIYHDVWNPYERLRDAKLTLTPLDKQRYVNALTTIIAISLCYEDQLRRYLGLAKRINTLKEELQSLVTKEELSIWASQHVVPGLEAIIQKHSPKHAAIKDEVVKLLNADLLVGLIPLAAKSAPTSTVDGKIRGRATPPLHATDPNRNVKIAAWILVPTAALVVIATAIGVSAKPFIKWVKKHRALKKPRLARDKTHKLPQVA